jgi:RNA polymerase sigma-70 factor (ECF subfamily)
VHYLVHQVLGSPGDWRLLPTSANGQPAAVGYRGWLGIRHPRAHVTSTGIARINAFGDPLLVEWFGFPTSV